jgi:hypothetical protein
MNLLFHSGYESQDEAMVRTHAKVAKGGKEYRGLRGMGGEQGDLGDVAATKV